MADDEWKLRVQTKDAGPKRLDSGAELLAPFQATFTGSEVTIGLKVDVVDGTPSIRSVTIDVVDSADGLELRTSKLLDGVPMRGLLTHACARVVVETEALEGGTVKMTRTAVPSTEAVEKVVGSIRRRRRPISDERLTEFVEAYRARTGTMRELARELSMAERHAYRMKKLAQDRGLLEEGE